MAFLDTTGKKFNRDIDKMRAEQKRLAITPRRAPDVVGPRMANRAGASTLVSPNRPRPVGPQAYGGAQGGAMQGQPGTQQPMQGGSFNQPIDNSMQSSGQGVRGVTGPAPKVDNTATQQLGPRDYANPGAVGGTSTGLGVHDVTGNVGHQDQLLPNGPDESYNPQQDPTGSSLIDQVLQQLLGGNMFSTEEQIAAAQAQSDAQLAQSRADTAAAMGAGGFLTSGAHAGISGGLGQQAARDMASTTAALEQQAMSNYLDQLGLGLGAFQEDRRLDNREDITDRVLALMGEEPTIDLDGDGDGSKPFIPPEDIRDVGAYDWLSELGLNMSEGAADVMFGSENRDSTVAVSSTDELPDDAHKWGEGGNMWFSPSSQTFYMVTG